MKIDRKSARSDGYIKNQNMRLKQMRVAISLKISLVVVPLAVLLAFFAGLILSTPSPEKWEHKQITFSGISREYFANRFSYFLNTTDDGRFVLPLGTKEIEELTQQLIPNKQYTIIFTENLFTKITESLSFGDRELIKLNESVSEWEKERKQLCIFAVVMLFLMAVGSLLIYTLWCKKERQQIAKIKSKIIDRLNKRLKN